MLPALLAMMGMQAGAGALRWIDNNFLGIGDWISQLTKPDYSIHSPQPSDNLLADYLNGFYKFSHRVIAPDVNDLLSLNNFFSVYGYSMYKFDVPNLCVRKDYTFIKTSNAIVKGVNTNANNQLQDMLNNGCTFWAGEIGVKSETSSNSRMATNEGIF